MEILKSLLLLLKEANDVAVHDPKTPVNRDADYIKKVSGFKVGTIAVKTHYAKSNLYIGDWMRVADEKSKYFNKYGYIVSKQEESDVPYESPTGGGNLMKIKIDISTGGEPEVVEIVMSYGALRRVKKWSDIDTLVDSVGGAAGSKAKADKEKATTKAAAKASSTEMSTSVASNVYGDSTAQPNMKFPTGGKPLYVDETKPRTAEEKKAAKDMIKVLEADLKIHKAFVEANPSPRDKDRAQVLKNAERIVEAFKKVDAALDDYIGIIKILNKEANSGDRELFDEAREELWKVISPVYDDLKTIKLKASIPKYVSRARVLAAIAIDHMYAERNKVDTWTKRRDWSKAKLAAAKKTSDRMKLMWEE